MCTKQVGALELEGDHWRFDLLNEGTLIADPEKALDFRSAVAAARDPEHTGQKKIAGDGGRYWLVLPLHNRSAPENLGLYLTNPLFSFIDVYVLDEEKILLHEQTGKAYFARSQIPSIGINDLIPFQVPLGHTVTLVVGYESALFRRLTSIVAPLSVVSRTHSFMQATYYWVGLSLD